MFYFNSKELQVEIKMLCVVTSALGYSFFRILLVGEGEVFMQEKSLCITV